MVKPITPIPYKPRHPNRWAMWGLFIAITGFILYFGLPPFIQVDEDGNYILSAERQRDYIEKPLQSEEVEVYKLVAIESGLYPCLRCPGIKSIRLEAGEVWKYGISRYGKRRYRKNFYIETKVAYFTLVTTDILKAEQMEKQLIIGYPLLPECQKRMMNYGIFLKRPPGNTKDQ